ncbi:MAG: alanine racemase, partial [bacterium]|nr:alanine racemase [bacterium]
GSTDTLAAIARAAARTAAADTPTPARVHLHIDTGMARDGAPAATVPALITLAQRAHAAGLIRVEGLMGHLAHARDLHANTRGIGQFARAIIAMREAGLDPGIRHLAATASALTDPRARWDAVRVGAGLYGIDPSGTTQLRSALTLAAPVIATRRVPAGTPVSYGATWHAAAETTLATIPLGYADGIPRAATGAEVWLAGRRRPIVGTVCMDQIVLNCADDPIEPGTTAVILGPGTHGEPTTAEWAAWSGTIEHEIVTGIGSRVTRFYDDDAHSRSRPVPSGAAGTAVNGEAA